VSTTKADVLQFCATADAAPSAPGAYILQIDIAESVSVTIAGQSATELTAGRYLYCGSAKGAGGLRARLARHMRRGKSVHWHIDQLTERGRVIGSWIVPNGRECELVAMLGSLPMPILGFGSSDCRRCRSHLLYRPIGVSVPLTGFNETAPYGSWKSPLVSDLIAAQSISLSEPRICWWETLRR